MKKAVAARMVDPTMVGRMRWRLTARPSPNRVRTRVSYTAPLLTPATEAAGDKDNHTEQRRLAKERRLARPNGTLLAEAKAQWELARQLNLPKGERQKHIAGLMEVVKGKVKDLVTKHDASRVIQTVSPAG